MKCKECNVSLSGPYVNAKLKSIRFCSKKCLTAFLKDDVVEEDGIVDIVWKPREESKESKNEPRVTIKK